MSKSNETTPNVPTLRFPEFTDGWSKSSFSDAFDILSNNTFSRAELNYESGTYKNIHYGDILIKFNSYVDVTDENVPYINDTVEINSKTPLLINGDVVFADTAEDYTVGKATEIESADKVKTVSGLHTIPCRPKFTFAHRYLGYFVNSPSFHDQLLPFIQGIKVSSISRSQIVKAVVSYPSIQEQTKISRFLYLLDNRIEVQNKIISKYETLIKGISHKLMREMNFKKFTLKELCKIVKGQQINGRDLKGIGTFYYLNGGTTPSGYLDTFNTQENTISISEGGNSCGFVFYNVAKFWSGGHCYTLQNVDEKCRNKYLYYYLKSNERKVMKLRVGSGLPNIQSHLLAAFLIELPDIGEQDKFIAIVDTLTKKKEIESIVLTKLQSQKKHLLSNLFI